jgi:hypothetical protein
MATWDDVPHLTDEKKKELWASIPPFERDARAKGKPQLGSGAIYPVAETEVQCEPFRIPNYWPRVYALDVGWNRTAAVWAAYNDQADVVYLYSEYYRAQAEPAIHADAIKSRGIWIPGVIDPSARGRSQVDGVRLIDTYGNLGLALQMADNSVEAGLLAVWQRLSSGTLKVFANCQNWFDEFRIYQRDEKGKIVKKNDHLMDATRYLIMSGLRIATTEPRPDDYYESQWSDQTRSAVTGY